MIRFSAILGALAGIASLTSAQIVVNGDFETGSLPPWEFTPDANAEPEMVATVATFQDSNMFRINPGHDGSGGFAGGSLVQVVALEADVEYTLAGDLFIENLRNGNNHDGGTIAIDLDGDVVHEFVVTSIAPFTTVSDSFAVTFTAHVSGSRTLRLRFTRRFRNTSPSIYHWVDNIAIEAASAPCYADCDGNGLLNITDFLCFIDAFAAAQALPPSQQIEHYANCTGTTSEPILSVSDFLCFIDAFALGCP